MKKTAIILLALFVFVIGVGTVFASPRVFSEGDWRGASGPDDPYWTLIGTDSDGDTHYYDRSNVQLVTDVSGTYIKTTRMRIYKKGTMRYGAKYHVFDIWFNVNNGYERWELGSVYTDKYKRIDPKRIYNIEGWSNWSNPDDVDEKNLFKKLCQQLNLTPGTEESKPSIAVAGNDIQVAGWSIRELIGKYKVNKQISPSDHPKNLTYSKTWAGPDTHDYLSYIFSDSTGEEVQIALDDDNYVIQIALSLNEKGNTYKTLINILTENYGAYYQDTYSNFYNAPTTTWKPKRSKFAFIWTPITVVHHDKSVQVWITDVERVNKNNP